MQLHNLADRNSGGYTTFGSVWSKGEQKQKEFILQREDGIMIPVQSQVMAWWPDGSIKWLSHSANSDQMGDSVRLLPAVLSDHNETEKQIRIDVKEEQEYYAIDTGIMQIKVPKSRGAGTLVEDVCIGGVHLADKIYPVFQMERRERTYGGMGYQTKVQEYHGQVDEVMLEESGPLQVVFCMRGNHSNEQQAPMPFVIRLYLGYGSSEIRISHTFLYNGKEKQDFLKGMGIRTEAVLTGNLCDKQIKFAGEDDVFHEAAVMLESRMPRISAEILRKQLAEGYYDYELDTDVGYAMDYLPVWDRYVLFQDSASHFVIKKQTGPDCCKLNCRHGKQAGGAMAVSGTNGSLSIGIRDFWQKYPSGLEVAGLSKEKSLCTAWFYCPEAEAFDFGHYDTRSYQLTCYEGFEAVGASAVGIGVTSQCTLSFCREFPSDEKVTNYGERIQKPPVYVGTPEYYHEKKAFGHWSLPGNTNKAEKWLEDQMAKAFAFYRQEIVARDWYGLFDYGDVMHTYDAIRHCWKYDVGGFAWQNTELVPTYWLWLYFLRTGREDVYTLAEAMSRHCSEVDVYHFGELKGLGSRHNVRHWGCSCKEPRIAMAGHHRFLYYLTGDKRLGDIFDEVEDGDLAMSRHELHNEKLPDGSLKSGVRSGPDWSSFVSNWMTQYERTRDIKYRQRIETGIRDIAATPFGLASGPDFYYDPETKHLIYKGEIEDTPNQHLQICMGGPQIWWETADMLGDDTLNQMLSDLGSFYFLSKEEKKLLTEGKISERAFGWPMLATGIAAYSAVRNQNKELALYTWQVLLESIVNEEQSKGFEPMVYHEGKNGTKSYELQGIGTNHTAQCCLNIIMCLTFIKEYLPEAFERFETEVEF